MNNKIIIILIIIKEKLYIYKLFTVIPDSARYIKAAKLDDASDVFVGTGYL